MSYDCPDAIDDLGAICEVNGIAFDTECEDPSALVNAIREALASRADVLSEARTRLDEAFQDAQHLGDTEAWREAALDTIGKIDAILTPIAEAA